MKPHEKLKRLINESPLTRAEAAKAIGISTRTLHQWIAGELPRIQKALGAIEKMEALKKRVNK